MWRHVLDRSSFAGTEEDKVPVHHFSAEMNARNVEGERITNIFRLLVTVKGEVLRLNDKPVPPTFFPQNIRDLKPLPLEKSSTYRYHRLEQYKRQKTKERQQQSASPSPAMA
jgi:hypothetical protein